jgi:hypothetical protein
LRMNRRFAPAAAIRDWSTFDPRQASKYGFDLGHEIWDFRSTGIGRAYTSILISSL